MPGLARVTWRAAGYAANLARGRNNWPNDCKTNKTLGRASGGSGGDREARKEAGVIDNVVDKAAGGAETIIEAHGAIK